MNKKKRIVIALGGNALGNTLPEQMAAVKVTSKAIVDLIEEGCEETIEDVGDYVFRINFLKNKQKILTIDYVANIFNETIVIKNVSLYLENL